VVSRYNLLKKEENAKNNAGYICRTPPEISRGVLF
jgi:hypothetical protein